MTAPPSRGYVVDEIIGRPSAVVESSPDGHTNREGQPSPLFDGAARDAISHQLRCRQPPDLMFPPLAALARRRGLAASSIAT